MGAVVLGDEIAHPVGQAVLAGQGQAVRRVRDDDVGTGLGVQTVVRVLAVGLVLGKKVGAHDLADVVIVGADARQERIGADRLGGALGHVADDDGVVISAGRLDEKLAKQRVRGARQFQ